MPNNPYTRFISTPVPQTSKESPNQVQNNAGGYSFVTSFESNLERFLIIGTQYGTYYVGEFDLTQQNVDWIVANIQLAADGGLSVLNKTLEMSVSGRAYRNSPAIFVLALLFKHGANALKPILRDALPKICRTSTHLFEFAQYVEGLGGWGRSKRSAVANWYTSKDLKDLAYQLVKYRQRNGWSHRDTLRLSHGRIDPVLERFVKRWYKDEQNHGIVVDERESLDVIRGFISVQDAKSVKEILNLLDYDYCSNLPWEALPTQFLKEPDVWKKLFYNGQLNGQALVRNITRLSRISAFDDMVFARDYANRLIDEEMIRKTRLHPINYLNAVITHTEGQVDRNNYNQRRKDWKTVPIIVDALNEGFHRAFKHIVPANKRTMIALDISGSMGSLALGIDLSCAQVGAAMAMSIARTEPYYQIMGFATEFRDLGITPNMSLSEVLRRTTHQNFGGTDCSLPMVIAQENKLEIDTFIIITDNETWAGNVHPHVALKQYRKSSGIDARLAVLGVASNGFTIADPNDRGMLDLVGFDSNCPKLVADFSRGDI